MPAIGGQPVQLQQSTVKVDVRVHTLTNETSLFVNVRVVEPISWLSPTDNTWKEYQLVRRDSLEWRKEITVTGPRQDLDALKKREQEVTAFITLTEEDKKPVSWNVRTVTVCFPPDLQVKLAPAQIPRYSSSSSRCVETIVG